jgi:hypothetical protein
MIIIGIIMGVISYIGKCAVFHMAIPKIMKWVHKNTLRLAIFDIILTYIASHAFAAMTNAGLIAAVTFGGCSTCYILFFAGRNKFLKWREKKKAEKEAGGTDERINEQVRNFRNGSVPCSSDSWYNS